MVGFLDSPYYIDIQPYTPTYRGFQYEEQQKYKYMNTKNIISKECAERYPSSPPADITADVTAVVSAGVSTDLTTDVTAADVSADVTTVDHPADAPIHSNPTPLVQPPFVNEQWKCQFGQYRLPFVQTSFFMVTSQYDSYQLQLDLGQVLTYHIPSYTYNIP